MRAFLALLPPSLYIPRFDVVALDWRVLVVSALVSIGATACFGLLPALRVLRPDLNPLLKSGARTDRGAGSVFGRPGSVLLVSEVCLTLVLLTATAMLTRSLRALLEVNERFQPERLLTLDVSFSNAAVRSLPDFQKLKVSLLTEFEHRVAAMPGVRSVAAAESFPLSANALPFRLDGRTPPVTTVFPEAELHLVTPNFFETMASSLVRGRSFAGSDRPGARPVAVINEPMARRYWSDSDPVGHPDRLGKGDAARPALYLSLLQVPLSHMSLIVRTSDDPRPLVGMLRAAALQISPGHMMVSDVRTGEEIVSDASARLHFASMLLIVLAAVALLLAVVGIYGLLAYYTAQRTHEMGIRVALGATRGGILRLVLRQGLSIAGVGVLLGGAIGVAFARSITSMLYHVAPMEPAIFLGAASFLLIVALLACYVPARRAANVDPIVALRDE